tara:strand:- start:112 stop:462 length:351 start_codon:yes stop_codon:yes gene_type:complete
MIKLKKILNESAWSREKFGDPLPTLSDVMEKHNCDCGGSCCTVTEGPDDSRKAKKELQRLMKAEGKFRDRMYKLEQSFLRDARPENVKLAKDIKQSYKKHVTQFMREAVQLTRKVK